MAEALGPPLFREPLVQPGPWTMTPSWQRWLALLTQHAGAPGPAGPAGPEGPEGPQGPQGVPGTPATLGPTLTTIEALTGTVDTFIYFTGMDEAALADLSAYSRSLLTQSDAGTWRSTLGLGTLSVQNAGAVAITGGTIYSLSGFSVTSGSLYLGPPVSFGDAATTRTNLGLGTLAVQNANAIAVTGGTITGLTQLQSTNAGFGTPTVGGYTLVTGAGQVALNGDVAIGQATTTNARLEIAFTKTAQYGLRLHQLGSDTTGVYPVTLTNVANGEIGSISSTATTVAYNTSSDPRLKEDVQALAGALETIQRLRPVSYRWRADGSLGHGFLADEVQQVVPEAVTGEPGAVRSDGSVRPQQMDMSKLVPWLVGATQELTARVAALEGA